MTPDILAIINGAALAILGLPDTLLDNWIESMTAVFFCLNVASVIRHRNYVIRKDFEHSLLELDRHRSGGHFN